MSLSKVTPTLESNSMNIDPQKANTCPICKRGISPKIVYLIRNSNLYGSNDQSRFSIVFGCPYCYKLFLATGTLNTSRTTIDIDSNSLSPNIPEEATFDERLSEVSNSFIEIYNQALAAEAYGLTQIAGMGFRKSLEFLIKDYAVFLDPAQDQQIKSMQLSPCISRYIDHPKIKATATAAAWLGNDETHYMRKWIDKDINDLKDFIQACVFWILADFMSGEAQQMIDSR